MNSKMIKDNNDSGGYSSIESRLLEPCSYIHQLPERQILERFVHAFNHWMKIPDNKCLAIKAIVQENFDSITLLDDIEDSSVLRRCNPVAQYGISDTMNSAYYTMLAALGKALDLNHPDAIKICVKQLLVLNRGQGMELYWRDTYTCPSEEDYREMAVQKRGGIFMMLLKLMQLFSETKEDFTKLSDILGLYLQIQNDYCNLLFQDHTNVKDYYNDITKGKYSFPIVHAVHNHPTNNQIIYILRQRTNDPYLKRHCVSLLEHFGSFEYTWKVLTEMDVEMKKEISKLGGNPLLEAILDEIFIWKDVKFLKE